MKTKNMDMFSKDPKTIGQSLVNFWLTIPYEDNPIPCAEFLRYQYKERYKALCIRCNIEPVSISKWLLRPINSI